MKSYGLSSAEMLLGTSVRVRRVAQALCFCPLTAKEIQSEVNRTGLPLLSLPQIRFVLWKGSEARLFRCYDGAFLLTQKGRRYVYEMNVMGPRWYKREEKNLQGLTVEKNEAYSKGSNFCPQGVTGAYSNGVKIRPQGVTLALKASNEGISSVEILPSRCNIEGKEYMSEADLIVK